MTHQRIRIRTDLFLSKEFASLNERADGVPLILPTPVPSIRNDFFKPFDDPEVLCLGNGKDLISNYNNNHNSKDLHYPTVKDCQGQIIEDEQSLDEDVWKKFKLACVEWGRELKSEQVRQQINESKETKKNKISFTEKELKKLLIKGIDLLNGSFSCLVCQVGLEKSDIDLHIQGKQHVKMKKILKLERKAGMLAERTIKWKMKRKIWLNEEYKQKLATKNEISSWEFILIKEFEDGIMKQMCILCDVIVSNEFSIRGHLKGRKHKANYERYSE